MEVNGTGLFQYLQNRMLNPIVLTERSLVVIGQLQRGLGPALFQPAYYLGQKHIKIIREIHLSPIGQRFSRADLSVEMRIRYCS